MEMEGLKENRQHKKGKLEHSKFSQTRPSKLIPDSPKARPGEFIPEKLGFFSSNSSKPAINCLGNKSLSPSPTRLNMRREA